MPTRRTLLLTAAATPLALSVSARRRMAAAEPVTVCGAWEMTGGIANTAALCDRGARFAVQMVGQRIGLPARYVTIDTQGDPGLGVRRVGEEMEQRGTRLFVGGASSAVALAVSKEIARRGGIYVTTGGADELTGTDCAKTTFRWPVSTYGAVERTVRPLRESFPQAKRWYTLTPQYVFGDALLRNVRRVLAETGAEHVGNGYHPLTQREFSGYLTEAMSTKPDVLCLLSFSGQSIDQIRQAADFGLKDNTKILLVWSAGLDQYQATGPDLLDGIFLGVQYWHRIDTAWNRELVPIFQTTFKAPPTYAEVAGYMLANLALEGMARAGSTDPREVELALEGYRYVGPTGDEEVRAGDHQCLKDYYLLRGKASSRMMAPDDFVEVIGAGRSFPPPDATGCKLAA